MLDPAHIIPSRAEPGPPAPWSARLGGGMADGAVSLLFNLVVIGALIHWAFPPLMSSADPQAISVEIVNEAPKGTGSKTGQAGGSDAASHGQKGAAAGTPASADAKPPEAAAAPPKLDAAKPGETKQAEAPSPPPPSPTPTQPSAVPPTVPAASPPVVPSIAAQEAATPANPATPPPLGPDDGNPKPHLVEAPADPHEAARQTEKNMIANASPDTEGPGKAAAPPPPSPPVVAAPASSESVPVLTPTAKPVPQKPPSAEAKRQAENTAKLAAALPLSQTFSIDPTRAAVSGSGNKASDDYKGAVYGAFRKADDLVETARANHLRGQAVIAFSIDDAGALTHIAVAVSSGNPAVDETALNIIRRSAPFPPPPPGAPHNFSPAIGLGLDEP